MKRVISIIPIVAILLLLGCRRLSENYYHYYVPKITFPEREAMLTTVFAEIEIIADGANADVRLDYKGESNGNKVVGATSITQFKIDVEQVNLTVKDDDLQLEAVGCPGTILYTMKNESGVIKTEKKNIVFSISGTVQSSISISASIFGRQEVMTLVGMTKKRGEANFGEIGYPSISGGHPIVKRFFANESEKDVSISFVQDPLFVGEEIIGVVPSGGELNGGSYRFSEGSLRASYYVLTFSDGRTSTHNICNEKTYQYTGLNSQLTEYPYLSINSGYLIYRASFDCKYIITSEVYANADIP